MQVNRAFYFYPIRLLLGFLVFSEILYFIGPIDYEVHSNVLLGLYLALLNVALFHGYRAGVIRSSQREFRVNGVSMKAIRILILLGFIYAFVHFIRSIEAKSISGMVNNVMFAITNSGEVYKSKLESDTTTIWTYVFMILAPISFLAQTLGVYHWKRCGFFQRLLIVCTFILDVLYWIARGTRKGIFDVILILFSMVLLSDPTLITSSHKNRKMKIWLISGLSVFVFFFVISNLSRYGLTAAEYADFNISQIRSFYSNHLPVWLNLTLANLTSYLCQGYRALSLALNDTVSGGVFCFTYGVGNNWFTINVIDNLFGVDILPQTYQAYLANSYGIDEYINWHSLYLWLANDFTFLGVPLLLYGLGYLFSRSWIDALNHSNKFAAPMAALCVMIIAYAFANNQVLSFNCITFVLVLFFYLVNGGIIKY